ncbi:MAG TPA: VWA domain-containing protein [Pyrinomonadaceae bacterium]|jgi:VWFA-related protein|nr:VWA domain-containing protein [Pyrinomonadaceae bacterium]
MAHLKLRRIFAMFPAALACLVICATGARGQGGGVPVSPQQKPDDVVRVETELVQTDVSVFDKSGKFVDGLKPEQFEIKVDGRAVPVAFFERVVAAGVGAAHPGSGAAPTPDAGGTRARVRYVVFFLDDVHLSAGSLERARKSVARFVEGEMGPNDRVLLATATGQLGFLQQFTDNKAVLRVALSRLTYRPFVVRDAEQVAMTEYQALRVDQGDRDAISHYSDLLLAQSNIRTSVGVGPPSGGSVYTKPSNGQMVGMTREQAERMVRDRAELILKQAADYSVGTLAALESLMRSSARLAGRKLVFFISDGFYINDRNTGFADKLKQITDAALRAGVVIYSIDARGLVGDTDASSNRADSLGRLARADAGEMSASQDPLNALAGDTGGRALFDSYAFDSAVSGALAESSNYYRLAWKPQAEEQKGGGFKRVEVSVVGRPELTVRLPRGYMASLARASAAPAGAKPNAKPDAGDKSDAKSAEADLRAAFASPVARSELPTVLSTRYVDVPGTGAVLTSSVQVTTDALDYGADSHQPAAVDIVGVVWNEQGKEVGSFKKRLNVTPLPSSAASSERPGVIYNQPTPLAPGLYQVKVAARDARGGQVGSAAQWIEIPDLSKRRLALSSLHLGGRVVGNSDTAKSAAAPQIQFSVDRRFARSSRMDFLVFIYNASRSPGGGATDLSAQVQLLRDGHAIVSAPARKLAPEAAADLARIPFTGTITLGQLPAGQYEIEVNVTDNISKTSATQRIGFEIQ